MAQVSATTQPSATSMPLHGVPLLEPGAPRRRSEEEAQNVVISTSYAARQHLVTLRTFTPRDFETDLDAFMGSAFQFEPTLTQSAWFRPHNKSEDVGGLFFVGAGTHPGAGLPGVISSAKVLEKFL